MEQNLKITVENEVKTLNVLTGEAEKIYHEKSFEVKKASIGAVAEFLKKLGENNEVLDHSKVEFSYENLFLNLYHDVRRRNPDFIGGILRLHPDLEKFEINSGKTYSTFKLADFIKMNRHYFENKEIAMKLVSDLRNFEGKVSKEVEQKSDNRANNKILINQVVTSNIPESFILVFPIFLGKEKTRITVEIDINSVFECMLVSPDLKQMIDENSKTCIDTELNQIKELHPDLKIFEL